MKCPTCGRENASNASTCAQCGMSLPAMPAAPSTPGMAPCPACGVENRIGARFCRGCGGTLPATAPPPPATPPDRSKAGPPAGAPTRKFSEPSSVSTRNFGDSASSTNGGDNRCPQCQRENRPGARFCLGCGYKFVPAGPPAVATSGSMSPTPPAPPFSGGDEATVDMPALTPEAMAAYARVATPAAAPSPPAIPDSGETQGVVIGAVNAPPSQPPGLDQVRYPGGGPTAAPAAPYSPDDPLGIGAGAPAARPSTPPPVEKTPPKRKADQTTPGGQMSPVPPLLSPLSAAGAAKAASGGPVPAGSVACPFCGSMNRASAKFCGQCRNPLPVPGQAEKGAGPQPVAAATTNEPSMTSAVPIFTPKEMRPCPHCGWELQLPWPERCPSCKMILRQGAGQAAGVKVEPPRGVQPNMGTGYVPIVAVRHDCPVCFTMNQHEQPYCTNCGAELVENPVAGPPLTMEVARIAAVPEGPLVAPPIPEGARYKPPMTLRKKLALVGALASVLLLLLCIILDWKSPLLSGLDDIAFYGHRTVYFTYFDAKATKGSDWLVLVNPTKNSDYVSIHVHGQEPIIKQVPGHGALQLDSKQLAGGIIATGPILVSTWGNTEMVVSQRTLSGGDGSFEEVPGYDGGLNNASLDSQWMYSYYDARTDDVKIMVTNPNNYAIRAEVWISGTKAGSISDIPGLGTTSWSQPGQLLAGPVIVEGFQKLGANNPAKIYTTMRTTTPGGDINEVIGVPQRDWQPKAYYTWYDTTSNTGDVIYVTNTSPTTTESITVTASLYLVNPHTKPVPVAPGPAFTVDPGTVSCPDKPAFAPANSVTVTLRLAQGQTTCFSFPPNYRGGPIQIASSGPVMSSQKTHWAQASFEELTALPANRLAGDNFFPLYDSKFAHFTPCASPNTEPITATDCASADWVLVLNPDPKQVAQVEIWIGYQQVYRQTLNPGAAFQWAQTLTKGQPLEVRAYVPGKPDTPVKILTSQRTLVGSGFNLFNEVPPTYSQ